MHILCKDCETEIPDNENPEKILGERIFKYSIFFKNERRKVKP